MSKTEENSAAFEFPVNVRTLPRKGRHLKYSGDAETMKAIAKDYDLIDVTRFEATCHVTPWKRDGVQLTGQIKADIVQPCAVTSEPLSAKLDELVEMIFVPDGSKLARPRTNEEGEWVFDVEGADLPDTFSGDSIDLAQVWLEFFAMGINPFARLEGAEFEDAEVDDAGESKPDSPFAALSQLKIDDSES